jgi:hypothetical protein
MSELEATDKLPAVAEVRVIQREEPPGAALARLAASPAVQAAAVAATSFAAGTVAVMAVRHRRTRTLARLHRRARRSGSTRTFLVDVTLLDHRG